MLIKKLKRVKMNKRFLLRLKKQAHITGSLDVTLEEAQESEMKHTGCVWKPRNWPQGGAKTTCKDWLMHWLNSIRNCQPKSSRISTTGKTSEERPSASGP